MNYPALEQKRDYINAHMHLLSQCVRDKYDEAFNIEYTHNSTAIEGNTLTLMETKLLLEDKLSIGGKHLREIYEVVNHAKAFTLVRERVKDRRPLDEGTVKDIHAILMENIQPGGSYRRVDVQISGAQHQPPSPNEMYHQVKAFYDDLPARNDLNAIELAAWTHAEFVRIHPYEDGNGRTSRMMMNYQLMGRGFLPVSVPQTRRLEYYDALEQYAMERDLTPFAELVAGLEEPRLDEYVRALQMTMEQTQTDEPTMDY